jgi:hypothetical protein
MKKTQKVLAILLVVLTLITMFPNFAYSALAISNQLIYTSASEWAKPEIEKAFNSGILPSRLIAADAKKPATREELCEISILLYEKVIGNTIEATEGNPFTDTKNPEILKAYNLGITSGTSANTFSPNDITSREQVATMFGRAIRIMYPNDDYSTSGVPAFLDQAYISSWALEHVNFMSKAKIILGSNNYFMPKAVTNNQIVSGYGTTKREEAIAIAVRIFNKYMNSTVSDITNKENLAKALIRTIAPKLSEEEKFSKIDFNNRMFRPIFKPKITLTAQDGYASDGTPNYSPSPYAQLVSSRGDKIESFKISLPSDVVSKTSHIIWQVSLVPFDGKPVESASHAPGGLLMSGKLSSSATMFSIDFGKVEQADNALRKPKANTIQVKSKNINYMAYLSQPNTKINTNNINPSINPSITSPTITSPTIILPNKNILDISKLINNASSEQKSVLQRTYYVRAYPVDSLGNSIGDAGSGLPVIYGEPLPARSDGTKKVYLPINLHIARQSGKVTYDGEFPNSFFNYDAGRILYTDSDKTYSVLPLGYPSNTQELRVQVSLEKYTSSSDDNLSNTPGLVYEKSIFPNDPIFKGLKNSKTEGIEIDFSNFVPTDDQLPEDKNIPYYIRVLSFIKGTQPGSAKALYSETVTISYGKHNPQSTNLFLEQIKINPPIPVITKFNYSPIQWEAINWQQHYIVFRQPTYKDIFGIFGNNEPYKAYAVGTKIDFSQAPKEDKSWWDEACDAITGFFQDLVSFVSKVTSWVSKAYADLKSGLIKFVASSFPAGWQGLIEKALTAVVDYGLASIGIPPTLPNFDELSELGIDYLATVAMESANIPANELIEYGKDKLTDELAGGLKKNITSSTTTSSPNPMNWNFIKLDPGDLYRPAYMTVELYNPNDIATPEGMLNCTVDTMLDLSLNGTDPNVTSLYKSYGSPLIYLYKPVIGMKIPAIEPGERLTVPIFLEEMVGSSIYSGGPVVEKNSFGTMYGMGEYNFSITIDYKLPPLAEEIKRQKYTENAIYSYSVFSNSIIFTSLPNKSFSK